MALLSRDMESRIELDESTLKHSFAEVEPGVRLHYVEAGEGPLVVLLHGFPEFWYAWRKQIGALVAAGFRVVAPDQRGYNLSDKPEAVRAYGMNRLVDDVAALIVDRGETKAFVVGHDWGAGVAWAFAMRHPERLVRLAILNGPHPTRFIAGLRNFEQLAKSWYMFFFQLPKLPEAVMHLDGFAMFMRSFDEASRPTAFDERDRARYVEAFSRPGAMTAMIDWYRAMFRPGTAVPIAKIEAPVLVLWGERDPHLGRELATPPGELVPNARVVFLPNATHWIQHEEPERVNEELVAFFRAPDNPKNEATV